MDGTRQPINHFIICTNQCQNRSFFKQFIEKAFAFDQYKTVIIVKTTDPKRGQEVTVALEKEAMMTAGCMYAFDMVLCVLCEACACPDPCCLYPHLARPYMDAYGIDIGKTVEPLGFKVEFDR